MSLLGKSAPSTVVGLDIGSELIKVAEAKLAKDGIQITGLGVAPTPEGALDNSNIVDPQALGAAIKRLLKESGIKAKHVVSTVTGQSSVVVRVIEVPKMTREELTETMKWEVERHVPFSPTEILMDFAPIDKPGAHPDAPQMEVLLAVAQQGAVNALVQTIFAAGLEPLAIDVQPLAVSRALIEDSNGTGPNTVAVVNIGANSTDVGIFEAGLLTFPGPPLPIAGVNITRAISEALGVPEDEAEMLKKEYAAADLSQMQMQMDAGFDAGGDAQFQQPDDQPTNYGVDQQQGGYDFSQSFDTAFPQADQPSETCPVVDQPAEPAFDQPNSDFSPFDFGAVSSPPPQQNQPLDISGEDVFDLGGGQEQASEFKPIFDLDEPDVAPQTQSQPTGPVFDLDLEDEPVGLSAQGPAQSADDNAEFWGPHANTGGSFADGGSSPNLQPPPHVQPDRQDVIQAVAPVLIELATEIRRSIDYYSTRYQNRPEQIFLCGGTAKMRDLDKFLQTELGIPVVVANPMSSLTVKIPKLAPEYLSEMSPLFPVCIGLAIREMVE